MDITCVKLDIDEVIACSLGLKNAEYKLFELLAKEKESLTASEIAKKLSLDRTTVQKLISSILRKGLLSRHQENLDRGGYVFNYSVKDKVHIKKDIKTLLKTWHDASAEKIDGW